MPASENLEKYVLNTGWNFVKISLINFVTYIRMQIILCAIMYIVSESTSYDSLIRPKKSCLFPVTLP